MTLVGSDALTYFCGMKRLDDVARVVGESLGLSLRPDWTAAESEFAGGQLKVSRRVFAPNSDFSRVVLGMHTAVRRGREVVPGGREAALEVIGGCDVMLGVVLTPSLVADDERLHLAVEWASLLQAVLFDGRWVLDSALERIVEVGGVGVPRG